MALVVSSIGILIHIAIGWPEGALPLAVLFLTYTVAAWCPLRTAFAGLGVLTVTVLLLGLTDSPGLDTVGALAVLAQFTAVWAIGVALRSRRMATDSRCARQKNAPRRNVRVRRECSPRNGCASPRNCMM